jgi:putative oxidoreductase
MIRRVGMLGLLSLGACVQRAYDRTVVYELDVSRVRGVQVVGVRGGDRPLSWERDTPLVPLSADSLYRAVVTYHTGYLATEVKFTVNGSFELANGDNRTVRLARTTTGGDTTVYRAVFDVR